MAAAFECLSTLSEAASLDFVLSQLYEPVKKAKSPKTIENALQWVNQALLEFGPREVDLKVGFLSPKGSPSALLACRLA